MDVLAIVLLLIALMALAGVVIYFLNDYAKYKDSNSKDVAATNKRVDAEQGDRLSNVKFVVDQVNTVNQDIYKSFTTSNATLTTGLSNVALTQSNMLTGMNKVMSFSSSNSGVLKLTDLPGYTNPDINLIQKVNATMGMTVKDLDKAGNVMSMCSKSDPSRCIKLPDVNGNTVFRNLDAKGDLVLQNLDAGQGIRLDGNVTVNDKLNFGPSAGGGSFINNGSVAPMVIQTGRLGVGNSSMTTAAAMLHVKGADATVPLIRVDTNNGNTVISIDNMGNNVVINSGNVKINGNLSVSGTITNGSGAAILARPGGVPMNPAATRPLVLTVPNGAAPV